MPTAARRTASLPQNAHVYCAPRTRARDLRAGGRPRRRPRARAARPGARMRRTEAPAGGARARAPGTRTHLGVLDDLDLLQDLADGRAVPRAVLAGDAGLRRRETARPHRAEAPARRAARSAPHAPSSYACPASEGEGGVRACGRRARHRVRVPRRPPPARAETSPRPQPRPRPSPPHADTHHASNGEAGRGLEPTGPTCAGGARTPVPRRAAARARAPDACGWQSATCALWLCAVCERLCAA
jgi:hypothetical protein